MMKRNRPNRRLKTRSEHQRCRVPSHHRYKRAATTPGSANARSDCHDPEYRLDVRRKDAARLHPGRVRVAEFGVPLEGAPNHPVAVLSANTPMASETPASCG